ncbi:MULTISPECIES: hypothetical protein [Bacillus]|uniref:Uncharacterized protein n=1 Tax=Bacillus mycoides TaxID=1405 RepID=A0A1G4EEU8_BACMY|nr:MULTISPECIES: hypothetical protein [Bacillus cereus group]MBJ8092041.1 hypothetical protein [Bacillus cereus]MCQ6357222.1 hypothetical protein [Bacillus cereus]CAH2461193.1 hypothetical protein ACOSJ1_EBGNOMHC_02277 [Bacillus mycoides KBAB4]SCB66378.1 Uncharacterized protein BWGO95_00313 [Bacillus mycoides]
MGNILFEDYQNHLKENIEKYERDYYSTCIKIDKYWIDESSYDYKATFAVKEKGNKNYGGIYYGILFNFYNGEIVADENLESKYILLEDLKILNRYKSIDKDSFATYRSLEQNWVDSNDFVETDSYRFAYDGNCSQVIEIRSRSNSDTFEKIPSELEGYINNKIIRGFLLGIKRENLNESRYKLYFAYSGEFGIYAYQVVTYIHNPNEPLEFGSWDYRNTENLFQSNLFSSSDLEKILSLINR